jgi:hypothetical protein
LCTNIPLTPDPLRIAGMHQLLGAIPVLSAQELFKATESVLSAVFHASADAILMTYGHDEPDVRGRRRGGRAERARPRGSTSSSGWNRALTAQACFGLRVSS